MNSCRAARAATTLGKAMDLRHPQGVVGDDSIDAGNAAVRVSNLACDTVRR
jgi:hypothetical protein